MTDVELVRPLGFELAAEAIKLACVLSMVGCGQGEHSGEGSIRCTKKRKAAALCIASSRVGEAVTYSNAEYAVSTTYRPQRHRTAETQKGHDKSQRMRSKTGKSFFSHLIQQSKKDICVVTM